MLLVSPSAAADFVARAPEVVGFGAAGVKSRLEALGTALGGVGVPTNIHALVRRNPSLLRLNVDSIAERAAALEELLPGSLLVVWQ